MIDRNELARVAIRQRREEHRIDDAEDRRIGADAEGERQQNDQRECRGVAQPARRVAEVVEQGVHGDSEGGVGYP